MELGSGDSPLSNQERHRCSKSEVSLSDSTKKSNGVHFVTEWLAFGVSVRRMSDAWCVGRCDLVKKVSCPYSNHRYCLFG